MKSYCVLIFVFFSIFVCGRSFAQSSSELKSRKAKLTKEIQALNKELTQTRGSKKLSLKQVNALNEQIRLRESKITTINSEIRLLDNQISTNTRTVSNLKSQLSKLKKEYAAMVVFAYRNKGSYSKLMFIFAARDFNQAYMRLKYLSQFGEYRMRQAREITHTQTQLTVKIKELDKDKQQKSSLLQEEVSEKTTLGKQKQKQTVELNKLTKQEKQLNGQIETKNREAKKLEVAIAAAINREIARAMAEEKARKAVAAAKEAAAAAERKKSNPTAPVAKAPIEKPSAVGTNALIAAPEAAKLSANFQANKGRLPWPVDAGKIARGFGRHTDGVNVVSDNPGINFQTNAGGVARAVFDGEVSMAQNVGSFYVVLIKHGEYFSVYSQLKSINVSRGDKVSTRQAIGTVQADPFDGTTQLHFELRKGVSPLNPASWLSSR